MPYVVNFKHRAAYPLHEANHVAMTFHSLDFDTEQAEVVNSALDNLGSPLLAAVEDLGVNTLEHNLVAMQWTDDMFGNLLCRPSGLSFTWMMPELATSGGAYR